MKGGERPGVWRTMDTCPESGRVLVWHVYQGVMIAEGARGNRFHARWTDIPEDWIRTEERRPERKDADAQQCVIAMDRYGEECVTVWSLIRDGDDFPAWQRPPGPPDNYRELPKEAE